MRKDRKRSFLVSFLSGFLREWNDEAGFFRLSFFDCFLGMEKDEIPGRKENIKGGNSTAFWVRNPKISI